MIEVDCLYVFINVFWMLIGGSRCPVFLHSQWECLCVFIRYMQLFYHLVLQWHRELVSSLDGGLSIYHCWYCVTCRCICKMAVWIISQTCICVHLSFIVLMTMKWPTRLLLLKSPALCQSSNYSTHWFKDYCNALINIASQSLAEPYTSTLDCMFVSVCSW